MSTVTARYASEAFSAIAAGLDDAAGLAWTSPDSPDPRAGLGRVGELRNRLDALAAQIALAVDSTWAHRVPKPDTDGVGVRYRSVANYFGDQPGGTAKVARDDLNIARWLLDFAVFADAAAQGQISRPRLPMLRRPTKPRPTRPWWRINTYSRDSRPG